MASAQLMTNILPSYYQFLEKESKRSHKTKREIIESALKLYIKEKKKESIEKAYQAMAEDEEYLSEMNETAELGISYFLIDIDAD